MSTAPSPAHASTTHMLQVQEGGAVKHELHADQKLKQAQVGSIRIRKATRRQPLTASKLEPLSSGVRRLRAELSQNLYDKSEAQRSMRKAAGKLGRLLITPEGDMWMSDHHIDIFARYAYPIGFTIFIAVMYAATAESSNEALLQAKLDESALGLCP